MFRMHVVTAILLAIAGTTSGCSVGPPECEVSLDVTEYGHTLTNQDTTIGLGNEPIVFQALGGDRALFEVVGGGSPSGWRLLISPQFDSTVVKVRGEPPALGQWMNYGDRIVIEGRAVGQEVVQILALSFDAMSCGQEKVFMRVNVVQ